MPSPPLLIDRMNKDIAELWKRCCYDEGFGFWEGTESQLFLSVHVYHSFVIYAKGKLIVFDKDRYRYRYRYKNRYNRYRYKNRYNRYRIPIAYLFTI